MDDPEEDEYWEYEEEYYNSSKQEYLKESNFSWFLRKGLSLGKNAVITGVVISSAPLFLPSLVVVSALGFAVSVPAGVVLASYTCTEKLMNKLLPIPAFSSYTIFEDELDEIEQFEVARKDQDDKIPPFSSYTTFDEECDDEIEQFEVARKDQDDKIELRKGVAAVSLEEFVMVSKAAGEVQILDTKKVHDNDVSRDKSKRKRNKKKRLSCLKISQRIGERESKKETVKHNYSVNWDAKSKVQNLVPIVEIKSSGNGISDTRRDELTVGVLKDSEVALYNLAKEDGDSYKANGKIPANEVLLPSEKILWEKVDALRLIVGYKAARKPSLSEELRALYVVTGIDPTSSFENSGDDVRSRTEEEKLRFLMSIIGVM